MQVNRTRSHWSKVLKCGITKNAPFEPFIITSGLVLSIPVFFYIGCYLYAKKEERRLQIDSRNKMNQSRLNDKYGDIIYEPPQFKYSESKIDTTVPGPSNTIFNDPSKIAISSIPSTSTSTSTDSSY